MKVLVVGAHGQLARSFAASSPQPEVMLTLVGRPRIELTRPEQAADFILGARPDLVVNAAAYTAVDRAEAEPETAHAINATGAGAIAVACAELNVPLLHLSTDYVFDGLKPTAYVETDPPTPIGAYGRSKLIGERLVAANCPRHVILRTAWVYSPYGNNFLKTMLRLARSNSQVRVVDDQIGSPTYAPHLASAILSMAEQLLRAPRGEHYGIFNIAGSGETSWCGLAWQIFEEAAKLGAPSAEVKPITTAEYPTPARRPPSSRLCIDKLRRIYGVQMPSWQLGVRECLTRLAEMRDPLMDPKVDQ